MIDLDTEICVCNSLTLKDIADCIKENNFTTLQELLQNDICPMGDKCESCRDEGYHNDGLNLPMVLAMVKRKQI
ncbi:MULTISPECIES: (2Fe-2S)-binding protein [Sulfurimonas]|uniref:(2Fe-2S)-binding protein n=1 Tax=Sulfurimonas TaxID=202746 RepID=UPI00125F363B|nr:(2Fe-2S)-binding protein [Sulfurimonas hydrogeniphila]